MLISLHNGAWIDSRAHIALTVTCGNAVYLHVFHDEHCERIGPFDNHARADKMREEIAAMVNHARAKERAAGGWW